MSNKDSQRVVTLHPDEHVALIIDRIGNSIIQAQENFDKNGPITDIVNDLYDQVDELESLRAYLRSQRGL